MPTPKSGGTAVLLSDGATAVIRPVRGSDQPALITLYEEMSPENLRNRFFGIGHGIGRRDARRLCRAAAKGHRALVAVTGERIIGVAGYESTTEPASAEVALAVADDQHQRGVGTLLLEHLVHVARLDGVRTFTADALRGNTLVQRVFADLGLHVERESTADAGVVNCLVALDPDDRYLAALDIRARTASLASLRPVLRPRSIAVVGAGRRPGSVGRVVLRHLLDSGFTGEVHAVNPHTRSVLDVPCVPQVADLARPPELAVISVPPAAVAEVADGCGRAGVAVLVVLTAGLDSMAESALLSVCRHWGMRLVGPNCLGIANTEPALRMDASFAAKPPSAGTAGVAVQSGGVGIGLMAGLDRLGIGISSFVSLGNKRDVSGNDLLQWWENDGRTELALLHLESFGNPRRFSRTARRVSRQMPVLTVDAGRSGSGRRAAASHTAAAATATMTRGALFAQAGITATLTLGELLDTAALLHTQPLPSGDRIAVVSNAGGAAVLAADTLTEAGLTVPDLPGEVTTELLRHLPVGASAANPVDITPGAGSRQLRACLATLAASGAVDALVTDLVPTAVSADRGDSLLDALTGSEALPVPVVAVLLDQGERVRLLAPGQGRSVPAYGEARSAALALAHAVRRAHWLGRRPGTVPHPDGCETAVARDFVTTALAGHPEGRWLGPEECARLLDLYAIARPSQLGAGGEDEAVAAATELAGAEGAVALKAQVPGLVHKSARGAVLLDVRGENAVRTGYGDLYARFGRDLDEVLVQPMVRRGTEFVAGAVHDPVFGPLVLFGLGGTAADVLAEQSARLAPLTDTDIDELLGTPRCARLLAGAGSQAPLDRHALRDLLQRVSQLACDMPELTEMDLNPVMSYPQGCTVVDSRVRMVPTVPGDPYLRRLP